MGFLVMGKLGGIVRTQPTLESDEAGTATAVVSAGTGNAMPCGCLAEAAEKDSPFSLHPSPVCGRSSTALMESCLMPAQEGRSNRDESHEEQMASHQPRSPANVLGALGQSKQAVNQTTAGLKA